jgi:predicted RNA-binding protein with PUA-like domain
MKTGTLSRKQAWKYNPKPFSSKTLHHFTQGGGPPERSLTAMPYLLKTEPTTYSFDDLERDRETTWDGISNPTALLNLRSMKPGEKLIIYHSNVGKAAVGTAKVVSVDASNPKDPKVRIQPVKRLKQAKTLDDMRAAPVFKDSILFRQFRLSVVPLTDAQYDWLTHP